MSDELKIITFSELVLRPCAHTYGNAPCNAELGVTGQFKCYNSPRTCQDPENFEPGAEQIIRWAEPTESLDANAYDFIPSQTGVETRTQVINPGESLGERESVTVTYNNHRHNDVGFDKYIADRGFNTYESGTFWGKFYARWPNITGCEFRVVRGHVGQSIEAMERRYYIVESTAGPSNKGSYQITAKDALKVLDGDKAQAPAVSNGVLSATLAEGATSLTLVPAGVGDEYPSEGLASIGDEVVSYTRSGDSITLTGRGLRGTEDSEHEKDETFQQALVFDSEEPSTIFKTLLEYGSVPAEYLDLPEWTAETTQHIGRLYSAEIMKPTAVKKLLDELIQQVGLIAWTDVVAKKIRLRSMRAFIPQLSLTDDHFLSGSVTASPQSAKRVSLVLTYYGQKNPLEKIDEEQNYRAILGTVDDSPAAAIEGLTPAIRKIYSRWITIFNRPAAGYINSAILARYAAAPRKIKFNLPLDIEPVMGAAVGISSRIFEDAQGLPSEPITAQIVSLEKAKAFYRCEAEELNFVRQAVDGERVIYIDDRVYNVNLRHIHDSIYTPPNEGDEVLVIVSAGASVGSVDHRPAFDVGSWPEGVLITLVVEGRIQGRGGHGGSSHAFADNTGGDGYTAIYTRYPITIDNTTGKIYGGGGGGGGRYFIDPVTGNIETSAGGGGAGDLGGERSGGSGAGGIYVSAPGTPTEGGSGAQLGGKGGDPGEDGEPASGTGGASGGTRGAAVNGNTFVTWVEAGDVRGLLV